MTLDEYQSFAKTTAIYPNTHAVIYPALGLCGEAGEVAEKIKKSIRHGTPFDVDALILEMGDVLWYLASLSNDLGVSLDVVLSRNVSKLISRKERDAIIGDGDTR